MKTWLARWDVTADEQATMSFKRVLTVVNLRRVEIACLLALFTKLVELLTGFKSPNGLVEFPLIFILMLISAVLRRRKDHDRLARGFVAVFLVLALLDTQWVVAAMGEYGRLTSAYPLMLLSLSLLFVLPPGLVATGLAILYVSYCAIVLRTPTQPSEQVVAIVNTGIVSVIAVIASALIYSGRWRDHQQKIEIQAQNDQLVYRSNELDSLMAITAHDLRSPLYGMRNLFDLAARRASDDPDMPLVALQQALPSIDAMLGLTTRLMDAHAAEHRHLPDLTHQDVRGHLLAALDRAAPLARSLDVRTTADLPSQPLIARLETGALAQIVDNLLSNAIRFSPPNGRVTLCAAAETAGVVIRVQDQGPGIDPTRRSALFEKFPGGAGPDVGAGPGVGMGLFIVATLAQRIGASVGYEQVEEGGARFIVRLATAH